MPKKTKKDPTPVEFVGIEIDLPLLKAIKRLPDHEGRNSLGGRIKYALRAWLREKHGIIVPVPTTRKLGRPFGAKTKNRRAATPPAPPTETAQLHISLDEKGPTSKGAKANAT